MKLLLTIAIVLIFISCSSNSKQAKIYEDSAVYYANKWAAVVDSGYTQNDSINQARKTMSFIYKTKRQYYIDKMNEAKK